MRVSPFAAAPTSRAAKTSPRRWAKARRPLEGSRRQEAGACRTVRRGVILSAMLRRFASALLVLLLLGAAVAGAATRRRGHECRMPAGHDCCKRARSDGHLQNDVAPPPCCLI